MWAVAVARGMNVSWAGEEERVTAERRKPRTPDAGEQKEDDDDDDDDEDCRYRVSAAIQPWGGGSR
jgi:hypothetical protein